MEDCYGMKPKALVSLHPYADLKSIESANQSFSWWLVHCFLYYRYNNPIISDSDFDKLTSWVKMSWDVITHQHKHLVTIEDLNAGSGYAIDYPLRVQGAAMHVLREIESTNTRQPASLKPINPVAKKPTKSNQTYQEYDSLFS